MNYLYFGLLVIVITINMVMVFNNQHIIIEQNEVLQGFLEVNMDEYCEGVGNGTP